MANTASSWQLTTSPGLIERGLRALSHYLRIAIGSIFILIGFLGIILPGLPATPFFLVASLIIGRRSRLLRRASISGKQAIRRWASHEHPAAKRLGRWSLAVQRDTSRRLRRINRWLATRSNTLRRRLLRV